ncbi:MAG TPA: flagellar protein FlaG [Bryobacteraceae bacterium]|nr:flagellar protein FlaG [Bryobacteraceae bacterium]
MAVSSIGALGNWATPPGGADAPHRREVVRAVKDINESGALGKNQLVFSIDSHTRRSIIRVENRETHELVLQIPPDYVLRLAEELRGGSTVTMS